MEGGFANALAPAPLGGTAKFTQDPDAQIVARVELAGTDTTPRPLLGAAPESARTPLVPRDKRIELGIVQLPIAAEAPAEAPRFPEAAPAAPAESPPSSRVKRRYVPALEAPPARGPAAAPRPPAVPRPAAASSSGFKAPAVGRRPEVLIVEDHPDERREIAEHLTRFGIKTYVAKDGRGALELLLKQEQAIDLVLLDLTLPDMDGFDVTRVIKSQPGSAQLPIVIMTTRLDRSRFAFGIQSGATDLLQKPLALESATGRIWNILAHRGFVPPPELMPTGRHDVTDPRLVSGRPNVRHDTPTV